MHGCPFISQMTTAQSVSGVSLRNNERRLPEGSDRTWNFGGIGTLHSHKLFAEIPAPAAAKVAISDRTMACIPTLLCVYRQEAGMGRTPTSRAVSISVERPVTLFGRLVSFPVHGTKAGR